MAKHAHLRKRDGLMKFATIVEIIGVVAIGGGIGVELALAADLGWLLISSGSLAVALGGLLWAKVVRL